MRRRAVLAAVSIWAIAPLVEAQIPEPKCVTEISLENRLRRATGSIMVECGAECWPVPPFCHTAPFGNWGVDSNYGPRTNKDQFRGWWPEHGHGQWNSCTEWYPQYHNDGAPVRQKAHPDDTQVVATDTEIDNRPCGWFTPEVYTAEDIEMVIWELDFDGDDRVATIEYGDISVRINCSTQLRCDGLSAWRQQTGINSAGVTAEVRIRYEARFRTGY